MPSKKNKKTMRRASAPRPSHANMMYGELVEEILSDIMDQTENGKKMKPFVYGAIQGLNIGGFIGNTASGSYASKQINKYLIRDILQGGK